MPHRLPSVQADDSKTATLYIAAMLRALPFQTIGDISRHGQELHVYGIPHRRDAACRRSATRLLSVGGPVTLAFLWCSRCLSEIDQAQLDLA